MSGSLVWPASIVVVEQLNHAQWHAHFPNGMAGGVGDWVTVMSGALLYASLHRAGVETAGLNGNHLVFALPEVVR